MITSKSILSFKNLRFLIIILVVTNSEKCASQLKKSTKESYKLFDEYIGNSNSGILNGVFYSKQFNRYKNHHEFYTTDDFLKADIEYNNQKYFDVLTKYDIYFDELIVKIPIDNNYNIYKLNKGLISNFSIDNKNFIHLKDSTLQKDGFYEKLSKEKSIINFFKKYKKNEVKVIVKDRIYYKFKLKKSYYLSYKNAMYQIQSKKSFINIFPTLKKDINSFYKQNRKLEKKDYDSFLEKLGSYLSKKLN